LRRIYLTDTIPMQENFWDNNGKNTLLSPIFGGKIYGVLLSHHFKKKYFVCPVHPGVTKVHFSRLFHISVFFYEYNVYKQFQLKLMEYPDKIWWYIPLWNSWTFCNFDAKYCQEIENCSTNSVCFFLCQSKSTCM
jgi:hypothetical protein